MGMDIRSLSQDRFLNILERCANHPDVRTEVIKNHDDNLWWPKKVEDWRLRLVIAGWSTRISYNMITTYQDVVDAANKLGCDRLADSTNDELKKLVRPLGLFKARLGYFRSLQQFIVKLQATKVNPKEIPNDDLVEKIAREVRGAAYKVAQCAALYAKGYHCGIIAIDSGMKEMLAPASAFTFRGDPGDMM